MLRITIILCFVISISSAIVSRNEQIKTMIDKISSSETIYNNLINNAIIKMDEDYCSCMEIVTEANCTNNNIWAQQRKKHSKNITNLRQKIDAHSKTITDILSLNAKETKRKTNVLYSILSHLKQFKNELEKIEGIEYQIKDTFLNIDENGSVLSMLKPINRKPFELLELRHDPGAIPGQQDYLPEHPEVVKEEKPDFNQGPPLIDEDIFDGFAEGNGEELQVVVEADKIPKGVDVKEHDSMETETIIEEFKKKLESEKKGQKQTDVLMAREKYKRDVKAMGLELFGRLERRRKQLEQKNEMYAQAISDLEAAIIQLHSKHGRQIVEIYMESRRLEKDVIEKEDIVMELDEKVGECEKVKNKQEQCESNKKLQTIYIENLKQQVTINEGILKELKKLVMYEDKNIEEEAMEKPFVSQEGDEIKEEIKKANDEINELKDIEKDIEKGLEIIQPAKNNKKQEKENEEKKEEKMKDKKEQIKGKKQEEIKGKKQKEKKEEIKDGKNKEKEKKKKEEKEIKKEEKKDETKDNKKEEKKVVNKDQTKDNKKEEKNDKKKDIKKEEKKSEKQEEEKGKETEKQKEQIEESEKKKDKTEQTAGK